MGVALPASPGSVVSAAMLAALTLSRRRGSADAGPPSRRPREQT